MKRWYQYGVRILSMSVWLYVSGEIREKNLCPPLWKAAILICHVPKHLLKGLKVVASEKVR